LAILSALGLSIPFALSCNSADEEVIEVRMRGRSVSVKATDRPEPNTTVRFVYAGVLSPERSTVPYARFASYMTGRLHRPVEVVRRRTHAELSELLRTGHAAAGLICVGAYAAGREQFGLRLLVVPTVDDKVTYQAYVLARRELEASTFEDLRGSVFAFSDPLSNSGYRYVAAMLDTRRTNPEDFFGRTFFTYSHDNTIAAVSDGIADAGVVHGAIWNQLVREVPGIGDRLMVIQRSEEFPVNPVVASPHISDELARELSRMLLDMPSDAAGREVLNDLGISGFVRLSDSVFDPITQSWRELACSPSSQPTTDHDIPAAPVQDHPQFCCPDDCGWRDHHVLGQSRSLSKLGRVRRQEWIGFRAGTGRSAEWPARRSRPCRC